MKIGIIGGGIAGLFTAWNLLKAGQEVTLWEKEKCGQGCSHDAAGMLAPINELEFQELALLRAGMRSREMYVGVEKELGNIGLLKTGSLEVGLTKDDESWLRRLHDFQLKQGLKAEWKNGKELFDLESFLSRSLLAGISSPDDWQVDHHLLLSNLREQLKKNGCQILEGQAIRGWTVNGSDNVQVTGSGQVWEVNRLVVASGTAQFAPGLLPYKIYPIRGEMIALKVPDYPFLQKTIRIRNQSLGTAYIVPKRGRILCGSTSEEQGLNSVNTAGGLLDILRKCHAAVPGLYELEVLDTWAGLRPATLDRMPIVDQEAGLPVYHLNGLYRHGVLLGPLVGAAMAELVVNRRRLPEVEGFRLK